MANSRIPTSAMILDEETGTAVTGDTIRARLYEHRVWGETPVRWIVQYAERNGRTVAGTRHTRRYSGRRFDHAEIDFDEVRTLLLASRENEVTP